MTTESNCPCGSGLNYSSCCLPVINEHRRVTTAETLMRSRYTAFVLKNAQHIQSSWHKRTRPLIFNFPDTPVCWLGLEIHACEKGGASDNKGTVDFSCRHLEKDQLCTLREVSEFLKEGGLWYYLQGQQSITKEKIAGKAACPCGSGRKFKRCCLPNPGRH